MAFDWGVFLQSLGGGVQQAGNTYFNTMIQEQQKERDAARDLEMFKQRSTFSQDIWDEQTSRDEKFKEYMVTVTTDAQKEYDDSKAERDANLSRFYGDPEVQNELEGYLTGGQQGQFGAPSTSSIKGMVMQDLLKKAQRGEIFTEQDTQSLGMLGFASQARLGQANFVNTQTEREFKLREQSATMQQQMYGALTKMYEEQIDSSQRPDPNKAISIINIATKLRQDIVSSEEYMYLKSLSDTVGKKKQKITPSQEAMLGAMEQNLQLTEMVIQSAMGNLQQQQTPSPGAIAPPPQQQLQPPAQQLPPPPPSAEQPGSVDQLGGLAGKGISALGNIPAVQDVFGGVIGGTQEFIERQRAQVSPREKRKMVEHAKTKGLMPDEVVHIDELIDETGGYNQEMLRELQGTGKFVFFDGKLHKIVMRGGKLGLVPVIE